MSLSIFQEFCGPATVSNCFPVALIKKDEFCSFVIRGSKICIYQVRNSQTWTIYEQDLHAQPLSATCIKLPNDAISYVIMLFPGAQLSVLSFDTESMDLKSEILHSIDHPELRENRNVQYPPVMHPLVTTTFEHEGSSFTLAAAHIFSNKIAVLVYGVPHIGVEGQEVTPLTLTSKTFGNHRFVGEERHVVESTLIISAQDLGKHALLVDMAFLVPASVGELSVLAILSISRQSDNTKQSYGSACVTFLQIDVSGFTLIAQVGEIPVNSFGLLPLPNGAGCLVLHPHMLIHLPAPCGTSWGLEGAWVQALSPLAYLTKEIEVLKMPERQCVWDEETCGLSYGLSSPPCLSLKNSHTFLSPNVLLFSINGRLLLCHILQSPSYSPVYATFWTSPGIASVSEFMCPLVVNSLFYLFLLGCSSGSQPMLLSCIPSTVVVDCFGEEWYKNGIQEAREECSFLISDLIEETEILTKNINQSCENVCESWLRSGIETFNFKIVDIPKGLTCFDGEIKQIISLDDPRTNADPQSIRGLLCCGGEGNNGFLTVLLGSPPLIVDFEFKVHFRVGAAWVVDKRHFLDKRGLSENENDDRPAKHFKRGADDTIIEDVLPGTFQSSIAPYNGNIAPNIITYPGRFVILSGPERLPHGPHALVLEDVKGQFVEPINNGFIQSEATVGVGLFRRGTLIAQVSRYAVDCLRPDGNKGTRYCFADASLRQALHACVCDPCIAILFNTSTIGVWLDAASNMASQAVKAGTATRTLDSEDLVEVIIPIGDVSIVSCSITTIPFSGIKHMALVIVLRENWELKVLQLPNLSHILSVKNINYGGPTLRQNSNSFDIFRSLTQPCELSWNLRKHKSSPDPLGQTTEFLDVSGETDEDISEIIGDMERPQMDTCEEGPVVFWAEILSLERDGEQNEMFLLIFVQGKPPLIYQAFPCFDNSANKDFPFMFKLLYHSSVSKALLNLPKPFWQSDNALMTPHRWVVPFENLGQCKGALLLTPQPVEDSSLAVPMLWLICRRGAVYLHVNARNDVVAASPVNTVVGCRLLTVHTNDMVRICNLKLPAGTPLSKNNIQLEATLPCVRIPLEVTPWMATWHPPSRQTAIVVSSDDLTIDEGIINTKEDEILNVDPSEINAQSEIEDAAATTDAELNPTLNNPKFSKIIDMITPPPKKYQLLLLSEDFTEKGLQVLENCKFDFEKDEVPIGLHFLDHHSSAIIIVATQISCDEFHESSGRLLLFNALQGPSLSCVWQQRSEKSPFTAICPISLPPTQKSHKNASPMVMIAKGHPVYVYEVDCDTLTLKQPLAQSVQWMCIYVACIASISQFVACGDIRRGIQFMRLKVSPADSGGFNHTLDLLSCSPVSSEHLCSSAMHCEFMRRHKKLAIVASDIRGNLEISEFVTASDGIEGDRVLRTVAEFNVGSRVLSLQAFKPAKEQMCTFIAGSTASGSIFVMKPLDDSLFKLLFVLSKSIAQRLPWRAGIDPLRWRVRRRCGLGVPVYFLQQDDGRMQIEDASLLRYFLLLSFPLQRALAVAVGGLSVELIIQRIQEAIAELR
eukprot:GHVL01023628.1.p1 GENE.GHVL01023628.1~~GHVL01023628.1.p1  ORF type:complete len:1551 (+),score=270.43 GHVL01023628.1:81-4733(+)